MKKELRSLRSMYGRYNTFAENQYVADAHTFFNFSREKTDNATLRNAVRAYKLIPFFDFLRTVKHIAYAKNIFDLIPQIQCLYKTLLFVEFLVKEGVIKVSRDGAITFLKKEWLPLFPMPKTEKEVRQAIETKLGIRIKENAPITDLFKKAGFSVTTAFDQAPISQGSAVFVVHKILANIPLTDTFLFVGDDDFISIMLGLADPSVSSVVIDADKGLLEALDSVAEEHSLRIRTELIDVRKLEQAKGTFTGFLCNPPYTEKGAEAFLKYGLRHLGKDGGFAFLELGNDAIDNRFLFLQKTFTRNGLLMEQAVREKITYPHLGTYEDYEFTNKRLAAFVDAAVVASQPELAATLYVFNYVPEPMKRIKTGQSIYAYL